MCRSIAICSDAACSSYTKIEISASISTLHLCTYYIIINTCFANLYCMNSIMNVGQQALGHHSRYGY